ncbi:Adenylate cyclase [Hyalangium minutum]|uniref:Adenylate cyclase n=2 Tax=Hyalangium minutum TaxID=394096 RepID=A0A085WLS1_9BACT|nr:Adenylate cyclase [Hyalangium minutum]
MCAPNPLFGDLLLKLGIVTPSQAQEVLALQPLTRAEPAPGRWKVVMLGEGQPELGRQALVEAERLALEWAQAYRCAFPEGEQQVAVLARVQQGLGGEGRRQAVPPAVAGPSPLPHLGE